jgi:phosphoribosylaminoimidazole carboxylase
MAGKSKMKSKVKVKPKTKGKTNASPSAPINVRVGVIMGSESDLKVMTGAIEVLKDFSVPHEVRIVSAHRTPQEMLEYATTAEERGIEVIIAGAGGAAHLPGMVASSTLLPVIGVPVNITSLEGLDALLSVVQMPKGVPVATVAIDNSANAGLLAVRILANADFTLKAKLAEFRDQQMKKVVAANERLATNS